MPPRHDRDFDVDPYALLEVKPTASQEQIRAAFRRLAMRYHPDTAGDEGPAAALRMAQINRAYALLRDPERRRRFDATRRPSSSRRSAGQPPPPTAGQEPLWAHDLEGHAEDWRQMYEEERQMWEQLLQARPPDHPERAHVEHQVQLAREAQLELENAIRARAGQPPLSEDEFERQRAEMRAEARRHSPTATGCLSVVALTVVGSALVVARSWGLATAAPWGGGAAPSRSRRERRPA